MGSSKPTGLQKLLVALEGEPFKEILAQHSLGTSQPAEVGQVVTHLLDAEELIKAYRPPEWAISIIVSFRQ